ncbi:hypothetical protein R55210_AODCCCNP_00078 [Fructobacillus fructosus]|uniref:hypothetical protein n=1 Tax=Fructobacillus fructosus TaxID=1631 RepID=UPI0002195A12|nr:hypothetical protein [Fructobacillus fructosus]KRN53347.1 hypothetical protein IV71_GL000138 [Fructobacillus fructosus KCTC 3544]GAP00675.1 membrane protein [Fructobacillus fructosus]CAK1225002.1 hypothetical protein R55210_AODCCCNP_00078 [Fructobacillus fructosus]
MVWYFWAGLWLAVLLLLMIWRFLYRAFPWLSFVDLATLPTWLALYFVEGAAFNRSDILAVIVAYLVIGGFWAFLRLGKNGLTVTGFLHQFWRISGLVAMLLLLITVFASLILVH